MRGRDRAAEHGRRLASVLRDEDRVAFTYRGQGHLLAMGTNPEAPLA